MNISLFNSDYWLRRFGKQRVVKGYLVSDYTDEVVNIHVHPSGEENMSNQTEGERTTDNLSGHGMIKLNAADQSCDQKADLILYDGDWYECVGCTLYRKTILSHYNYQFAKVPLDAADSVDLCNKPSCDP